MFGYIYLTTNTVNGKKYIGQHKANKFDTTYIGSGKLLRKAIEKYGWDAFSCVILEECNTKAELDEKEREYTIKYNAVADDDYYNLVEGGTGGCKIIWTEEKRKNISEKYSGEGNPMYGVHRYGEQSPTFGKIWSEDERQHQSIAQHKSYIEHPERWNRPDGFMAGETNPNYGKTWYTNGIKNKGIRPGEPVPEGFYKGFTTKRNDRLKNQ